MICADRFDENTKWAGMIPTVPCVVSTRTNRIGRLVLDVRSLMRDQKPDVKAAVRTPNAKCDQ